MEEHAQIFLSKIKGRIRRGEFDKFLTIPFLTKESLFTIIKEKVNERVNNNVNPALTESEIMNCVKIAREDAGAVYYIFRKMGILEETSIGLQFNDNARKLLNDI